MPMPVDNDNRLSHTELVGLISILLEGMFRWFLYNEDLLSSETALGIHSACLAVFVLITTKCFLFCRCPYAACGNTIPLRMEDMVDNHELKALIQRQLAQGGGGT